MNPETEFGRRLQELIAKHPHLSIDLDWGTVVCLIGTIQLALRHPGNTGYSAGVMRDLCDSLITRMEGIVPSLGPFLRMGYDPTHDVPKEGK